MADREELTAVLREPALATLAQEVGLISDPLPNAASSPRTPSRILAKASPMSTPLRAEKREADSDFFTSPDEHVDGKRKRMRPAEKGGKGLRHFSMKVCQKVKEKGVTTYNEVADELVEEQQIAEENGDEDACEVHGPKNIRRRVYDALNVLMAMNIISKEKKEIRWIGLPTNSAQEFTSLSEVKEKKRDRVEKKKAHLQELILQQIAFKNLIKRNEKLQANKSSEEMASQAANSIHLPFIIVNTSKKTVIDCQMAEDKSEYFFDFNMPFEIHDDIEVLKRMGMAYGIEKGTCTEQSLEEAKTLIPTALEPYLLSMVKVEVDSDDDSD